ncbi:hypothetical protein [Tichowtungia aerotolerans]|uniref:Uncharacterized protein n=1 Tax=Tichowtungia aerotolerans TaxID=2697043 RepID=A0A6P1M824_9BACT|nr:hypothetical protein [Tichowtungia aerotolerans]QHI68674.1 hypothetical protein GT409_04165 [Tichowtungia aerotolerans]
MGTSDLAKEALRIAGTAGLSKDVIDLLKEKINLLDEKVDDLTSENSSLKSENYDLRKQLESLLESQSDGTSKPEGFDDTTDAILKLFFDVHDSIPAELIARELNIQTSIVRYHFDLLSEHDMIRRMQGGTRGFVSGVASPAKYGLCKAGREYVVKNLI